MWEKFELSEWKEGANKRRNERQDPSSTPNHKFRKRKKKKNFKLEHKLKEGKKSCGLKPDKWYSFGYYDKEEDAQKAIKSYENKFYWDRFEYQIKNLTSK